MSQGTLALAKDSSPKKIKDTGERAKVAHHKARYEVM